MALCKKPFKMNGSPLEFGCGQCMPCRVNKSSLWTNRLLLESLLHAGSTFATLTYSDEFLPKSGSVSRREMQLFIKRVIKHAGRPVRYYYVGEYGDESFRPHYHVILFGLDCYDPQTRNILEKSWTDKKTKKLKGFIDIGDVNPHTCAYTVGYVTKKMTKKGDPRLGGLAPEFAQPSLRPGIGADAMKCVARAMNIRTETGDVVTKLVIGKKEFFLGRYLSDKLRKEANVNIQEVKELNLFNFTSELFKLQKDYESFAKDPTKSWFQNKKEIKKQRLLNFDARTKLFKKGKKL